MYFFTFRFMAEKIHNLYFYFKIFIFFSFRYLQDPDHSKEISSVLIRGLSSKHYVK